MGNVWPSYQTNRKQRGFNNFSYSCLGDRVGRVHVSVTETSQLLSFNLQQWISGTSLRLNLITDSILRSVINYLATTFLICWVTSFVDKCELRFICNLHLIFRELRNMTEIWILLVSLTDFYRIFHWGALFHMAPSNMLTITKTATAQIVLGGQNRPRKRKSQLQTATRWIDHADKLSSFVFYLNCK